MLETPLSDPSRCRSFSSWSSLETYRLEIGLLLRSVDSFDLGVIQGSTLGVVASEGPLDHEKGFRLVNMEKDSREAFEEDVEGLAWD